MNNSPFLYLGEYFSTDLPKMLQKSVAPIVVSAECFYHFTPDREGKTTDMKEHQRHSQSDSSAEAGSGVANSIRGGGAGRGPWAGLPALECDAEWEEDGCV